MPVESTLEPQDAIAIVGMWGVFPGAPTPERLWANIVERVDATAEVPTGRWAVDPGMVYDPRVAVADHVYSTRGGFVSDAKPDERAPHSDQSLGSGLDPLFHLALQVAQRAWCDARMHEVDRRRVGVVFGNIVLPTETASRLSREVLAPGFLAQAGLSAPESQRAEPANAFPAGLPAALVARALGLEGPAYTLDAACASSLYALKLAVDELESGRADAMIAGGVSRPDSLYTQMGFSQLKALSARGKPAPFDSRADGLVVGEGAGMFILKRLADALKHGDRIYALLTGVGLSNDVQGDLLAPSAEGQVRAMRMAYEQAGWCPSDVDLIECHAPGTPLGDAVEVRSLKTLWDNCASWQKRQCVLGSVKSNIGHALTAAGAAGLLKVLLALQHRILPPTANFERPSPQLELEESAFRVLSRPESWPSRGSGKPRRAALSGFGFGGINAHVLIEEWMPPPSAMSSARAVCAPSRFRNRGRTQLPAPIAVVGVAARFGPFEGKLGFQAHVLGSTDCGNSMSTPNWSGLTDTDWFRRQGRTERTLSGYYLSSLEFGVDEFRIPPSELAEMLPQQALMLGVAADALRDARWDARLAVRTSVLIGIGLDLNTTNYHLRWSLAERAREGNAALGLGLAPEELDRWVDELRRAAGPALNANRTMGSLGGVIASRIARQFRIGGPSFTVSCDENSGIQALSIAHDWLRRGELDAVVVGAVDLAGDARTALARDQLLRDRHAPAPAIRSADRVSPRVVPFVSDGAVCLVLKRLEDARRDHDRIYAVIRGVTTAMAHDDNRHWMIDGVCEAAERTGFAPGRDVMSSIGLLEVQSPSRNVMFGPAAEVGAADARVGATSDQACCGLGSIVGDLGDAGAAAGLASVAKSVLCLEQQVLPALRSGAQWLSAEAALPAPFFVPTGRQFWLRNRADGRRRAAVISASLGGQSGFVFLEEFDEPDLQPAPALVKRSGAPGPRQWALFAVEADDRAGFVARIAELRELAREQSACDIEALARIWWSRHPNQPGLRHGRAVVCDDVKALCEGLDRAAERRLEDGLDGDPGVGASLVVPAAESASPASRRLAFVYPGLGSHFAGMGRELSALWPGVLRDLDSESSLLWAQLDPSIWWNGEIPSSFPDHRAPILGNVWVGNFVTDLLRSLGVIPGAAVGYSMGETTALVALRAWTGRDDLLRRLQSSSMFQSDLAGPCDAARRHWGIPACEPVEWTAGIVPCSLEKVHEAIAGNRFVYALIRNTTQETVIGGRRHDLAEVVKNLRATFFELPHVSTVHCEVARAVQAEYQALHDRETIAPSGIVFYSGAWGRPYLLNRESASDAITALATQTIDFPAVITRAYEDGVRVFLEVGPGGSCTRLIDQILGGRPHLARSACLPDRDPLRTILDLLGDMIAFRLPVDLGGLYGGHTDSRNAPDDETPSRGGATRRKVCIAVRGESFHVPPLPAVRTPHLNPLASSALTQPAPEVWGSSPQSRWGVDERDDVTTRFFQSQRATAEAHRAFLRVSQDLSELMGKQAAFRLKLVNELRGGPTPATEVGDISLGPARLDPAAVDALARSMAQPTGTPPLLDRSACLEFAVGSIAAVLGPEFAPVDRLPSRVRLPAEPLMLVDRILAVEGEPRSLERGRVVTEHVIQPGRWYLDDNKIPACIAIEAGQADLFLSGYLGIDFETRGLSVYRLLDAKVTFHRALPGPGDVIRYDIRITSFFRQGKTILFRFEFDATVAGEPLLTMRDGCAGFFTAEELAAGKGIVAKRLDAPSPRVPPCGNAESLVPLSTMQLDEHELDALRRGDLAGAFGPPFDRCLCNDPLPLPGGRMGLLDRVQVLNSTGGPFGLGLIRALAGIHPGDWFLVCHFVDDRVMPGTLMYECCLHALRIFMMRLGWIGRRGHEAFEPVPGIAHRLKCRGQIVESTRVVTYEVVIKELGYRPEPYALADALILADGKPIVEVSDMGLQLSGSSRHQIEQIWAGCTTVNGHEPAPGEVSKSSADGALLFNRDQVLAFALGKPSAAFGERYLAFDEGRFIARLPGPAYGFLHGITGIDAEPWVMAAGASAHARYDIAPDAWFFESDRQNRMPFAALLEVALQACGWLAAYMGSALNSSIDLRFRNLGGTACQHRAVTRDTGALTASVRATKITGTAGMILQDYEFSIQSGDGLVYEGAAGFGFFPTSLLAEQAGIRDAAPYESGLADRAAAHSLVVPDAAPFPDSRWRMIDRVEEMALDGGPRGLGFIRGSTQVNPEAWFFQAHFLQDPVWPGSLGLESILQLLKLLGAARYGVRPESVFESPALGQTHRWTYRGQITPSSRRVTVQAEVTARDDARRWLLADGYLWVDDTLIYQMKDFSLRISDK
jgi:acyl transferase domain-containing protein/3-hydroxymyristoyl/3-hydroxydecanoyl-(acyl carrier protein) dehydratase